MSKKRSNPKKSPPISSDEPYAWFSAAEFHYKDKKQRDYIEKTKPLKPGDAPLFELHNSSPQEVKTNATTKWGVLIITLLMIYILYNALGT